MTREENIEAVRSVYARWAVGDFQASIEVFDPLILFVISSGFPEAGAYLGVERVREYTRAFLDPWSRVAIETEELQEAGNSVVAAVRQHGVGGGSGAETDFRYFQVWTFRGSKAIRLENFRERDQAMAAVGLA